MLQSPRVASIQKRHLVGPSPHHPWSVDVVSVVPKQVVDPLPNGNTFVTGAIQGRWAACGFPTGFFYVWQHKTANLNEPLETPTEVCKIFLPDFACIGAIGESIEESTVITKSLIALSSAQGDDSVLLYVLHPKSGNVTVRKIERRDLYDPSATSQLQQASTIRIADPTASDEALEDGETFQSLACKDKLVIAATSRDQFYMIAHIPVPFGLRIQKVEAAQSGLWSRLFKGTTRASNSFSIRKETSPRVLPHSSAAFVTISEESGIVQWKVEEKIASSCFADFYPTVILGTFSNALSLESWKLKKILQAAMTVDHCYIHAIVEGETGEETRLYWVVFDMSGTLVRSHWLSRFAVPNEVETMGLITCENDTAYASFSVNGIVIVMVLLGEEDFIQEIDVPRRQVPGLIPGMMSQDMVTHGCCVTATSGIVLRIRYLPQEINGTQLSKKPRLERSPRRAVTEISVQALASHLRSHFWECYQDPAVARPIPPSLQQNDINREQAIIDVAIELQHKGDASLHAVVMEYHLVFIKLIQEAGLYRSLSTVTKWKMLSIGQEISVFGVIAGLLLKKYKDAGLDWIDNLHPYDLGEWFLNVQKSEEESSWLNGAIWEDILGTALEIIWTYQKEMAEPLYDVAFHTATSTWISHPSMQTMLFSQLSFWKTTLIVAPLSVVEVVVKTALLSFYQSWQESGTKESKLAYLNIQARAISLLRANNDGNDEVAFQLCIEYEYFDGLCEIALSHERKIDANSYRLEPLFDSISTRDLLNNLTFPRYVLQWHTDRKLFGHVLNYGRNYIQDLNLIMDGNADLRQFKWISAIRQGHFDQTTKSCIENAEASKDLETMLWNLSFAKLSNKLVASQNQPVRNRQREIEKKIDLIQAQKMIQGEEVNRELLPAEKLIELAIVKLSENTEMDEQVQLGLVALTICSTLTDSQAAREKASQIWAESLLLNGAVWSEWALGGYGNNLKFVREEASNSTVFGMLLNECRKEPNLKDVTYSRSLEQNVIDRVQGDENRESFTRVLRAVAEPEQKGIGESLIVSTYDSNDPLVY